jgi:hypothetical protein
MFNLKIKVMKAIQQNQNLELRDINMVISMIQKKKENSKTWQDFEKSHIKLNTEMFSLSKEKENIYIKSKNGCYVINTNTIYFSETYHLPILKELQRSFEQPRQINVCRLSNTINKYPTFNYSFKKNKKFKDIRTIKKELNKYLKMFTENLKVLEQANNQKLKDYYQSNVDYVVSLICLVDDKKEWGYYKKQNEKWL